MRKLIIHFSVFLLLFVYVSGASAKNGTLVPLVNVSVKTDTNAETLSDEGFSPVEEEGEDFPELYRKVFVLSWNQSLKRVIEKSPQHSKVEVTCWNSTSGGKLIGSTTFYAVSEGKAFKFDGLPYVFHGRKRDLVIIAGIRDVADSQEANFSVLDPHGNLLCQWNSESDNELSNNVEGDFMKIMRNPTKMVIWKPDGKCEIQK